MSATDPLREALAALIDEISGPVGGIRVDSEELATILDGGRIAEAIARARRVLAAVPAETEAWEWRAVMARPEDEWERVDPEPRTDKQPREFWREVPCGHPPDPVAWHNGAGHVCHCGNGLDDAKGIAVAAAPGPVVLCQKCGCNVACPEPRPQDGGEQ